MVQCCLCCEPGGWVYVQEAAQQVLGFRRQVLHSITTMDGSVSVSICVVRTHARTYAQRICSLILNRPLLLCYAELVFGSQAPAERPPGRKPIHPAHSTSSTGPSMDVRQRCPCQQHAGIAQSAAA